MPGLLLMTSFDRPSYCSDRSCFNCDCDVNLDETIAAWAREKNLKVNTEDLRDTDVCVGYKSLNDINEAIQKRFPSHYWEADI
jgi:hypothetical protein